MRLSPASSTASRIWRTEVKLRSLNTPSKYVEMTTPSSSTTPKSTRNPPTPPREVHAPEREHDEAARGRDEHAEEDHRRDPPAAEAHVEHHEHDAQRDGHQTCIRLVARTWFSNWPTTPVVPGGSVSRPSLRACCSTRSASCTTDTSSAVAGVHRDIPDEQPALALDLCGPSTVVMVASCASAPGLRSTTGR